MGIRNDETVGGSGPPDSKRPRRLRWKAARIRPTILLFGFGLGLLLVAGFAPTHAPAADPLGERADASDRSAALKDAGSTDANPKDDGPKDDTAGDTERESPPLSLETLYHPHEKFPFASSAPPTRWIEGDPHRLVVRRDDRWKRVDLQTGDETDWEIADELERQILELDGVDKSEARRAASKAGGSMDREGASTLVPIGDALAVVAPDAPARWLTRDASRWENATLDPTHRRVAYTTDGDLFLRDVESGRSIRLTDDGSETRLNGILDWTYQEEIFGRGNYRGFWFSHDGQRLAMMQVDIAGIEPYVLSDSSADRGKGLVRRYSKAGDPIPHATLVVWDLRDADRGHFPSPKVLERSTPDRQRIITGVWWDPNRTRLLYSVSDRLQTWRDWKVIDETRLSNVDGEPRRLLREESPAWVEPPAAPRFLDDGSFVWRSEVPSGFQRLYRVRDDGRVVTPLSPEGFHVDEFWIADDGAFALVTGDAEGGTVERHVYRIDLEPTTSRPGSDDPTSLIPLTSRGGWHDASFHPDGSKMVVRRSTPTTPPQVTVVDTNRKHKSNGSSQSDQGNDADGIDLGGGKLSLLGGMVDPQRLRIETDDGFKLPAMLIRPRDDDRLPKTPVVMEIYGGPRAPVVTSRWGGTRALYREWLARNGIATLLVDNRSSGGRGLVDTWPIRHRVGEIETEDLLAAAAWLQSQDWVDPNRLAVRGWSFGGYMTLMAMTHSDAFAAGIAGGSVTDWREYDSFYTERYMGLPDENESGYQKTSPIDTAEKISGRVLMIHGELDDNVHPANTLRMADALQAAGKPFDLMIYPGAAHAIHHPNQVWHLARLTDGFLRAQLLDDH